MTKPVEASAWRIIHVPSSPGDGLLAVSCPSRTFCVAVGQTSSSTTLVESWNGHVWKGSPGARLRPGTSWLSDVDCISRNSCWAVGSARGGRNLVEHWNGTSWRVGTSPTQQFTMYGLSCAGAGTCVTVGSTRRGAAMEVWDGARWKVTAGSEPNARPLDVSCVSRAFCEAVGGKQGTGRQMPVTESWNGVRWTDSSPIMARGGELFAVSCWARSGCIAVGYALTGSGIVGLVEKWNGHIWSNVRVPFSGNATLRDVACTSASDCVVVGQSPSRPPLAFSWNGRNLTRTPTPRLSGTGALVAVAHVQDLAAAVGGTSGRATSGVLIEMN